MERLNIRLEMQCHVCGIVLLDITVDEICDGKNVNLIERLINAKLIDIVVYTFNSITALDNDEILNIHVQWHNLIIFNFKKR